MLIKSETIIKKELSEEEFQNLAIEWSHKKTNYESLDAKINDAMEKEDYDLGE
jgi:hypothetical protein